MSATYLQRKVCILAWTVMVLVGIPQAIAQTPDTKPSPGQPAAQAQTAEVTVQFSFDGAPWKDVIQRMANAADLALHIDDLPTGSFTYTDPRTFTHQQALSRVNLFLLPQGFTLVRSGKLLSVINLGDPRSLKQLDALAKFVTVDQLDAEEEHNVVKCIFALGDLKAEDAVDELSGMNLMTNPSVFTKTNRLMITDTAGKLKNVKAILDAFSPKTLNNGTVVKGFTLKHIDAEQLLTVARPHLGLATGEMIGIDVSVSADPLGKSIFVTGVEDKVKLIEGLIESVDQPDDSLLTTDGTAELKSHSITGDNTETVYNVLLTLLADKPVRLSMDTDSGTIVALASPEVQKEIVATIEQLQESQADFEVIPLKNVDPFFAVSLLEQMLDLPDPFFDDEDADPNAPKIDADSDNMRLYVRGKKHQIEQIKKIVQGLDGSSSGTESSDETIRLIPLKGKQAERVLKTAGRFWRGNNPVLMFPSDTEATEIVKERLVNEDDDKPQEFSDLFDSKKPAAANVQMLSSNLTSQAPPIRCQVTSRGLMLQCADTDALDEFENHLRTITGPVNSMPSPPVVFYLKYARPDDALRMLAELLDGGESAREGDSGSLVNGFSSSSTFLGSLLSSRGGTTTMMFGTITVVAETRLNRLIAQGTAEDIELIEGYLKIIDKDASITAVETHGRSHVIELQHTRASEVAAVISQAYAGRIASGSAGQAKPAAAGQAKTPPAKSKETPAKSKKPEKGKAAQQPAAQPKSGGGGASVDLTPKMTVAVHEPSNSLIVTAPESLFNEVEQLAKMIDTRSRQSVRILNMQNPTSMEPLLRQMFPDATGTVGATRSKTAPKVSASKSTKKPKPSRK